MTSKESAAASWTTPTPITQGNSSVMDYGGWYPPAMPANPYQYVGTAVSYSSPLADPELKTLLREILAEVKAIRQLLP